MWSLVRHTAGLLKKRVEDLAEVILMFILLCLLSCKLFWEWQILQFKLLTLKSESRRKHSYFALETIHFVFKMVIATDRQIPAGSIYLINQSLQEV